MLRRALPFFAALGLALVPMAAGAQVYVVGELNSPSYFEDGFPDVLPDIADRYGVRARIGYTFGENLKISIEGGAAYATFEGTDETPTSSIYQGFGGLRLAVGDILSPGVYLHVGYGEARVEPEEGNDRFRQGITGRLGVSLDLFSTSDLVLGAHLDWNRIFLETAFENLEFDRDWATLGIHGGVKF